LSDCYAFNFEIPIHQCSAKLRFAYILCELKFALQLQVYKHIAPNGAFHGIFSKN